MNEDSTVEDDGSLISKPVLWTCEQMKGDSEKGTPRKVDTFVDR